ncbi:MAG: hypothetical protein COV74_09265 [Candidatus Omnitrophica bacterium CG11_big_fil_rev_8_21_14_0_20_45_26]|uniref:Glycosyl transferase family 1 domain-containing protein n=1 Tax=Candidatus Abzuiibacterium crystallinum TaxID=1974748 RepID=A0A2H0LLX3_9BACT|nr:MAG: hypothetical protein COV74_09265 [Candidatus Omnitrophica bacterium CG11_big_fil_rev_8_21_14_0_20_45_26]PIW63260.1 MAG: hypothetical protein COW12_11240 [Candidatus Omnitrophica bacterium CG12_big_fil_rev_8_21_14_0_65_45_16]
MKKKAFFVKPVIRAGAFYFRISQYMDYLKSKGWDVCVLYPAPDGSTMQERLGFKQTISKIWFLFCQFPKFLWNMATSTVVFVFPSPMMGVYVLWAKLFRKKIIIEHIVSYISHQDIFPKFPVLVDQFVYRSARYILTHTQSVSMALEKRYHIPHEKILVSYCALDLEHFSAKYHKESEEIKKKLNITGHYIVFYHGLHHPWHALDLILEAAALLENTHPQITFLILPEKLNSSQKKNVLQLSEHEHYSWQTLPHYIQTADLWVSGFRVHERGERSFGSTLIQAMAMARPIITSPGGEKNKFLIHEENAFFVPPNSSEAIKNKIIECFKNPNMARQVGMNARKTAEKHFSIDHLEKMLKEAIR